MVQPKQNRFLVESLVGAPLGVAALGLDAKLLDAHVPARLGATELNAAADARIKADVDNLVGVIPAKITQLSAPGALLDASRTVVVGDSLTRSADSEAIQAFRGSWFTHAHHASSGLIRLFKNAAHGGWNSTQLRAVFDAEVLATNPTLVGLMCGRNDTPDANGHPKPLIDFVTEAVAKCRARGIGVFLVNTVPQGNAALPSPVAPTVSHTYTGSPMPARTYRYKITAGNGGTGAAPAGETLPGAVGASLAISSAGATVKVTWPHIPGANWYRIYRETTDGSGVYQLLTTIAPGASTLTTGTHYHYDTSTAALGAEPPAANTTANAFSSASSRARINAWLAQYAATEGIPLVDAYSILTDPLTGMFKDGLTYDGTHPTGKANALLGEAIAAALAPLIRPAPPIVSASAMDPINLTTDGLLATGSATLPTGFVKTHLLTDTSGVTARELRAGFKGYALRVENPAPTMTSVKGPSLTGMNPGNRVIMSCVIEAALAAKGAHVHVAVRNQAGTPLGEFRLVEVDRAPRVMTTEFVVPAGTTSVYWLIEVAGQGMAAVGQLTTYNLTTESYLPV